MIKKLGLIVLANFCGKFKPKKNIQSKKNHVYGYYQCILSPVIDYHIRKKEFIHPVYAKFGLNWPCGSRASFLYKVFYVFIKKIVIRRV